MPSDQSSSLTCWGRLSISAKLMLPLSVLHLMCGIVLLVGTGIFSSSRYSSLFGGEVIFFGVFGSVLLLILSVLGCLNAFDQERRHRWSITHVIMSAVIMFGFFLLLAYGASPSHRAGATRARGELAPRFHRRARSRRPSMRPPPLPALSVACVLPTDSRLDQPANQPRQGRRGVV